MSTKSEKKKYGKWEENDMSKALEAYRKGKYGVNQVCRIFNLPKPTFLRHLNKKNIIANDSVKSFGRTTIFPSNIEDQLVSHILNLEEKMFGITIRDVRRLAYQLADRNNIKHNFNQQKQMAGKAWYYGFMARHKKLSLRQPESTSMARIKGFNRENVSAYFDLLEKIVDDHKLDATKIYNVDESGFSTVQKKNQKILALRGKNQVGTVSSGERGVNTTIVCCVSASGLYVPPIIIFKRKRESADLKVGAPPGSVVTISDTGYINSDLFVQWLKHFISFVKPTVENKVLLLLDGHSTHSRNLEALELARDSGIILLQLPGHTTHRLQPLDVAFFKPLESFYTQAIEKWLRTNPGLCVTQYQVCSLLSEAYARAATVENSINGFRASGAWPVDRNVFKDHHFAGSDALEETLHEQGAENLEPEELPDSVDINSSIMSVSELSNGEKKSRDLVLDVSIHEIAPVPKCSPQVSKRMKKKAQGAAILTSSPYKRELEDSKQKQNYKTKPVTRKLEVVCPKKRLKTKPATPSEPQPSTSKGEIEIDVIEEEWYCSLCETTALKDMIRCHMCTTWYHESCTQCKPGSKKYICDSCK